MSQSQPIPLNLKEAAQLSHEPPYDQPTPREGDHFQAYTVEQVATMLHIGRDKIYYLLRTGQLRSIKIGKLRRITGRHLAQFVASLEDRT
jgi:excisionase family DNA binding protein